MQLVQTLTYIIILVATQSILVAAKTLRGTDNSFIIQDDEKNDHQRQLYQEQELPWVKYINPAKRDPHRELLAGRAYRMFTAGAISDTDDVKSQSITHHVNSAIEEGAIEEDNLFEQEVSNQLKKDPRIIGGSNAGSSEFPWAVSMQDRIGHFCGGSLIASNIVLTAA